MPLNYSLLQHQHRNLCQSRVNYGVSLSIAKTMDVQPRQARCRQCRGPTCLRRLRSGGKLLAHL